MSSTIYDRGSRQHASGRQSGSHYIVAAEDTFYSIGLRFGVPWQEITRANNLGDNASVVPGTRLIIPGLSQTRPTPPETKTPSNKTGTSQKRPSARPAGSRPRLGISSPAPGGTIYARYTVVVSGSGSGLRDNKVIVRVKDTRGPTLARRETTLDASGRWQVEFREGIPVHANSEGIIEAESPGSDLRTAVNVNYR